MGRSPRDRFLAERDRCAAIGAPAVRDALLAFADAVDPRFEHAKVPSPTPNGGVERESLSNSTGKNYLSSLRSAHARALDLLGADAETVNAFMRDLVTPPDDRTTGLVDYDGKITKPSAKSWQSALRAFYRWCDEPGATDRPDAAVPWPADAIEMFRERSAPKHDESDRPTQATLNAMREACLSGQNTRRDRAFIELAAGTGQRVYALVTLRIGDVRGNIGADIPHVLLNPDIRNDGDKGAIETAGRMRPVVTDVGPVRTYIDHHPLSDPAVRSELGAPKEFDDCYLFVGSLRQRSTDPTSHWGIEAARNMLDRRKADTASLPGVETVDVPVNPHNWRHYAYTRSKDLPLDEDVRRLVFGWRKGSDTGDRTYGHKATETAARQFVEAHREAFDDAPPSTDEFLGETAVLSDAAVDRLIAESLKRLGYADGHDDPSV